MQTKELRAVKETTEDLDRVQRLIEKAFREQIYVPLLAELRESEAIYNSTDEIAKALMRGRISYRLGKFTGRFNATISKELKKIGAVWDKKQQAFVLPKAKVPPQIRSAIAAGHTRFTDAVQKIQERISKILPENVAEAFQGTDVFDELLGKLDRNISKTLEGITIQPKLSDKERRKIADGYTDNMRLYIKDWTEEEIVKLRKSVEKKTFLGQRYEDLAKTIERRYQVSKSKAKFLARQETNLFISEFKETRYKSAGSTEYTWCCVVGSQKHPVRPMHKKLNGTRQSWDRPPVVNEEGQRKNPGQDYGCRCFARPIIKF